MPFSPPRFPVRIVTAQVALEKLFVMSCRGEFINAKPRGYSLNHMLSAVTDNKEKMRALPEPRFLCI